MKHFKLFEEFVNEGITELNKVGPALDKFLKEKGLNWPSSFKVTEEKGKIPSIQIDSDPVSSNDLGIMRFGFKNVTLSTKYGYPVTDEPDLIIFNLRYLYKHPNGGSNGTELILPGTTTGNVYYSKSNDKFYTEDTLPTGVERYLATIASDYQFDKNSDDYLGFLNTEPNSQGKDAIEFINNVGKYRSLMKKYGLSLEPGYNGDEAVFIKE